MRVNYRLTVKNGLPNIPKVGMQMGIENSYSHIEWFGKGPMENYADKCYGADAGIYQLGLSEFMENYAVPQENGNRMDVRWMQLVNKQNHNGLLIVADSLLSMNASAFTDSMIQNAKHTNKLKPAGYIVLHIDLKQMGVGGNDSWSEVAAPLEPYQIKARNYQYRFYLIPLTENLNRTPALKKIHF
jgi:beta-galactosidase